MSSSKGQAAASASRQYETLAKEAYGLGIPMLANRNAALMPALRQANLGQLLQDTIANLVTMTIIDVFEEIDVHHQYRKFIAVTYRAAEFKFSLFHEVPAIKDAGQIVNLRLPRNCLLK